MKRLAYFLFLFGFLIAILGIVLYHYKETVRVSVNDHVYSCRRAFKSERKKKNFAYARTDSAILASRDSVYLLYTFVPANIYMETVLLDKPNRIEQNQCLMKIKSVPIIKISRN